MATPNFSCSYQHYYLNSVKGKKSGDVTFFNNPTQGNGSLTQYTVNEVQMDYSFFNIREPYNQFKLIMRRIGLPTYTQKIVIPPGNYDITALYDKFRELFNSYVAFTGWLCTKCELEANTYKCVMEFMTNGDVRAHPEIFPSFQLSYGMTDNTDGIDPKDKDTLPIDETNAFYSIMLWLLGRQIPSLAHKNLSGADYVSEYHSSQDETHIIYKSPTLPQAGFDCYAYLISEYMNNFDTSIYEDVTEDANGNDLNITGANISDIWLKVPVSYYNFGDRVWYWPKTPYTFTPRSSNQLVDIKVVDQFNRPLNLNNGNYNMHLVFYESRDTNFI